MSTFLRYLIGDLYDNIVGCKKSYNPVYTPYIIELYAKLFNCDKIIIAAFMLKYSLLNNNVKIVSIIKNYYDLDQLYDVKVDGDFLANIGDYIRPAYVESILFNIDDKYSIIGLAGLKRAYIKFYNNF